KGFVVICDRFLDSTVAYQGYGLGMDRRLIEYLGKAVTGGIKPDLTLFLDLPVEKGLLHRKHCSDRIEKRPLDYHKRVRMGYFAIARKEPKRLRIVRVEQDKMDTQHNIRAIVDTIVK
ncbi:MAG: dTMP kinase, partial [Candidatus Omnitrophica bacterium]|nr:dTMP kinase [Candidatus Omnitrophota bacterium]